MASYNPTISIKITNLPQIRAAFAQAPYLMAKQMQSAIHSALIAIKARSMSQTPVDTGRLMRSTYTKEMKYSALNFTGEVGTGYPSDPQAYYDIFVHEGTRYMKGRPYLRQAVEQKEGDVDEFFHKAVQNVLDEIGRKV